MSGIGTHVETLESTVPALLGSIGLYLLLMLLVLGFSRHIARVLLGLNQLLPNEQRPTPDRRKTLEGLVGSLISLLAVVAAVIATLSHFVSAETLLWITGLFSAAFGLGARAMVADVVAGGRFIFRNTFAIGEKVEFTAGATTVDGIVEEVNVTNTTIRSRTGELCVVPNGEISVIRNYTAGPYSIAKIKFTVKTEALARTLALLEPLGQEAVTLLPELSESWQVISTSDVMGPKTELTVTAHTEFAKAAMLKLRMFEVIYRRLGDAGIELAE